MSQDTSDESHDVQIERTSARVNDVTREIRPINRFDSIKKNGKPFVLLATAHYHLLIKLRFPRFLAQEEAAPPLPPVVLVEDIWIGGHPSPHALLAIRLAPHTPLAFRRDALLRHERPSLAVAHKRRILIGNASRLGALRLRPLSIAVGEPLLHLRLGVGAEEAGPALPPTALVVAIWLVRHPSPHALLALRLPPRMPLGLRREALLRHERPSLAVAHKRRILIGNASRLGALRLRRLFPVVGVPLLHLRLGVEAKEAVPALPPAVLVSVIWMGGHPPPHALLTIRLAPRTPLAYRRDALLRCKRHALRQARPPPSRVRKRPAWLQVEAATKRLKHLDDRKLHHLERRARPCEPVCKAKER
eukprot:scaffold2507_cov81-Phaeocystis_antarctica.AAC.5